MFLIYLCVEFCVMIIIITEICLGFQNRTKGILEIFVSLNDFYYKFIQQISYGTIA